LLPRLVVEVTGKKKRKMVSAAKEQRNPYVLNMFSACNTADNTHDPVDSCQRGATHDPMD